MKKPKKKINNGLIVMNKGERIGVISLLSVITVLLAFSVFRPVIKFSNKDELAYHNLDSMIAIQEREAKQRSQYAGATNAEQASITTSKPTANKSETISNRPIGNSNENIGKPNKTILDKTASYESKTIPILDINIADSLTLMELPQIGEVMASRIQRYRERLGGFVSLDQLFEVKGMDSARFVTIKPYIILETTEIRKINVNRDEFKTLLRHPYLEYDQVKAIVNHRERKGLIKNWEQLKGITDEVNPFLEHYIRY